jgi:Xaa-Pro aminopeptidase
VKAKRTLLDDEVARYREIGRDAGSAMREALEESQPDWTENDLAAAGARAMWKRGLHPTLTLVAGERRLKTHRHPFPTSSKLGGRAMLVYCARRSGLYANLTRFVYFRKPSSQEMKLHDDLFLIEERILAASRRGETLSHGYDVLKRAYAEYGHEGEIEKHHQGGTCGYLSRETVATPTTDDKLDVNMAVAWNPSLAGAKLEDTFLIRDDRLENLTEMSGWPSVKVNGLLRPSYFLKD